MTYCTLGEPADGAGLLQLVRESADPAGGAAYADGRKEEVSVRRCPRQDRVLGADIERDWAAPVPRLACPALSCLSPEPGFRILCFPRKGKAGPPMPMSCLIPGSPGIPGCLEGRLGPSFWGSGPCPGREAVSRFLLLPWLWPPPGEQEGFPVGCPLLPCCPQVIPEVGRAECGLGRRTDSAIEAPPPNAGGPTEQVLPPRPQGTPVPRQPAGPAQPSDHSYALLDLDALKNKLFVTLRENEKLRKRLRAQRLAIQRLSGRLRAHRPGQLGSRARLRLEPEMSRAARFSRPSLGARTMDPALPPLTRQGTVRRARHTPATSGDV